MRSIDRLITVALFLLFVGCATSGPGASSAGQPTLPPGSRVASSSQAPQPIGSTFSNGNPGEPENDGRPKRELRISNDSAEVITQIYLERAAESPHWGGGGLLENVLPPRGNVVVDRDDESGSCIADLIIHFANSPVVVRRRVNVCEIEALSISEPDDTITSQRSKVPSYTQSTLDTAAPYRIVRVYFATDRALVGPASFGNMRSDQITYGEVKVSIPRDHRMGALEAPEWRYLRFKAQPEKDVMVLDTTIRSQADFFSDIRAKLRDMSKRSLLVFVHGFNVSFADAARRTAQMAYDLHFDGAPVFFSWPSQDQTVMYTVDEQAIVDAEPHLESFLRDVLKQSDADNIYLIAHSMGNRGLTRALIALSATEPKEVKRIKEVILAAPDIGTTEFTEQIAPGLVKLGAPITLYASSNDHALGWASKSLHGGPRAGEAGDHLVVLRGIETIDASNTDTDLIGHSYYGDRRSVLADMYYLIHGDLRAKNRCCLEPIPERTPRYWVFLK